MFYVVTNVIPCEEGKIDVANARPITREEVIALCRAMGITVVEDNANAFNDLDTRLLSLESTVRRLCSTITAMTCPTDRPTERDDNEWDECDIEVMDTPPNPDIVICAVKNLSEYPERNDTMPAPHKHED